MISSICLVSHLDLHTLLQDTTNKADKWGVDSKSGRIGPFTEVYDVSLLYGTSLWDRRRVSPFQLVFVMTTHMLSCRDLTTNEADLKKFGKLFMTLQTSTTPVSLLLPWFPSPARKMGRQATTDIYTMLYTYVGTRRHMDPTSDAIDILYVPTDDAVRDN